MNIIVLGQHVQGLIAGARLAKAGHQVDILCFPDDEYKAFYNDCKIGPVTHIPLPVSLKLIQTLDLQNYGFEKPKEAVANPFQKLPFYEGLQKLVAMFIGLEEYRPPYKEKAWRDTWNTFEIARILSEQDEKAQSLFARSATLSLIDLLNEAELDAQSKAEITAYAVMGSKTDPAAKGSAAAILPAMAVFESQGHVLIDGSLHTLVRALKQAAMANGANVLTEQTVKDIIVEDDAITTVILSDSQEMHADYFVLDYDPVVFFNDYMGDYKVPLTFKKRIAPEQNTQECLHVKMALTEIPEALNHNHVFIATDDAYIAQAKSDMRRDGGSQYPVLSVVNVGRQSPSLKDDGLEVLDVVAQYFEPGLQDLDDGPLMAVTQALTNAYPEIKANIKHSEIAVPPTQFGQANFIGSMALLHLYKVFSGYHAMGYDVPLDNLLVAGYGSGTAGHYHVNDGGMRIADLLQSL